MTPEQTAECLRLYREGRTLVEIVGLLGLTLNHVYGAVRKAGIIRKPGGPVVALRGQRDRLKAALLRIAARCGDWSPEDVRAAVADALGVSVADLVALQGKGP